MATRNKTLLFLRKRKECKSKRVSDRLALQLSSRNSVRGFVVYTMNKVETLLKLSEPLLMEKVNVQDKSQIVECHNGIYCMLKQIEIQLETLGKAYARRLMVTFDANAENRQNEKITILTDRIKSYFERTQVELDRLDNGGTSTERRIRKNMQHALAKKLDCLSIMFRNQQQVYLTKLDSQSDYGNPLSFLADAPSTGSTFEVQIFQDADEKRLEERSEEIKKIQMSVKQLSTVFRKVAAMVLDQDTIVDRIDYNIDKTAARMKESVQQLHIAEDRQKNGRAAKCIWLLSISIFVCIAILAVKHYPS